VISIEPSVVVEGWLTDVDTIQSLRLTYSQEFDNQSNPSTLSNATVSVIGNNQTYSFNYQTNGWYHSDTKFKGFPGNLYFLRIELSDGSIIESTRESLRSAPAIDSINYTFYTRQSILDPNVIETIYYPIAEINDNPNQVNHYWWRLYKNDSLLYQPEYMVLISDRFFNGNTTIFESEFTGFEFSRGDSIGMELLEISTDAFNFLSLLKSQTTTIGTVSSVTPAPINGNLSYVNKSNNVLGYWGVVSLKKRGIKISQ